MHLETIDNTNEMLECVKKPKYGYGSGLNPCIDCRIIMLRKAKEYMRELGASFVITGEVLGQRPMSQRYHMLRLIEREAGLEGFILRPLCAKSLKETIAEKKGWIDRKKLLNIVGRSRKGQIAVARSLGINDYPCPAGGCLLTDPNFAKRLKDLMTYKPKFSLNDILLLKLGRQFRINQKCKLIVGRNEKENNLLVNLSKNGDLIFRPEEKVAGPIALGRGRFSAQDRQLACSIVSRYCDREDASSLKIEIEDRSDENQEYFDSHFLNDEALKKLMV
jgi:tRNA U34 2-thiouridine synthase MnmA/TrmU